MYDMTKKENLPIMTYDISITAYLYERLPGDNQVSLYAVQYS